MSIRIWHQSFTVLSDLGAYDEALRAHFRKVARPGTQIHMHGMLPGTYRNNYPGDDIKYSALQYLHGLQFMAAGINAQDQHRWKVRVKRIALMPIFNSLNTRQGRNGYRIVIDH